MEWFTDDGYYWSRLVFQRGLAALYCVAFLAAANQFRALIGERGLTPVPRFTAQVPFKRSPSLFHLRYSDRLFAAVAWTGAALSAAMVFGAADAVPLWAAMAMWLVLWLLYLSIVNVGQVWYGFGWESLLLEAGFLAVFLGNAETAPPVLILFLLRWLLFRVEFGAGLIKMRGDRCWRDLTCLYYHHETQPMPGPLSWFFHHLPKPLHKVETAANHVAQLGLPVLLFLPQPIATAAALAIAATQLWLVISGNFSWLNWITILLALSAVQLPLPDRDLPGAPGWFTVLVCATTALMLALSYWPARNLLSRRQKMNASFNSLHLANTYGAFGSITRVRQEIVIEGTDEALVTPQTRWQEYEFKGKPGDPHRLPRQYAPYHLRLDWLMWFAAMSPSYAVRWFPALIAGLLANDRHLTKMLRRNPFATGPGPTHIRARLYHYSYSDWQELRATGNWWHRELVGEYLPPVKQSDLVRS
ncbi:lipase maturation factor family protein [Streptomyces boninensis]|uniref:lipase maturation factor family protein n=1 Tax=Streptomyces boninensis TaxID=2039455 RepID=UPI003B213604